MQPQHSVVPFWACFALACLTRVVPARAEETRRVNAETPAVRAAARDYAAAIARGDTETARRAWTKTGDYVDASGQSRLAQSLLSGAVLKPRAGSSQQKVAPLDTSIRFITPTVAIEDGTYDCDDLDDGSALTGRFTAIWVKQDGRWLLDGLRESESTSPHFDEKLKPLEWMLGEWVGQSDDSVMLVSAHASQRGNSIIRELAVLGDGIETTATERIAWDPSSREIKSWAFDSQDGRGESRWTLDGRRWLITTRQMMDDGTSATTTATITPNGDEQFVWEVMSSKIGDASVPGRRVTFTRAAEGE